MLPDVSHHKSTKDWVSWIARLQPWYLLIRFPHRLTESIFAFAGGAIAIGIISTAAALTGQPLLFPSLGPSAFLFFSQPTKPNSCPRNAILSHGSGILVGWLSYWLFGVVLALDTLTGQVAAATLSLGVISALMVAARISHPPAASTTLLVALGLMVQWGQLIVVMAAVVVLTLECYLINRLSGIVYPLWHACSDHQGDGLVVAALRTESRAADKDAYKEIADRITARKKITPPNGAGHD